MDKSLTHLASLVVQRRKELKINQDDLSELTQVAIRTIRDIEKGIGNPSVETLQKIMDVLGMELVFRLKK